MNTQIETSPTGSSASVKTKVVIRRVEMQKIAELIERHAALPLRKNLRQQGIARVDTNDDLFDYVVSEFSKTFNNPERNRVLLTKQRILLMKAKPGQTVYVRKSH